APEPDELPPDINGYDPFQWIETFTLSVPPPGLQIPVGHMLRPLVILDDAHALHAEQFDQVFVWLTSREMKIGRWLLTRFDIFNRSSVASNLEEGERAGANTTGPVPGRDFLDIRLQEDGDEESSQAKKHFQRTAKDMASRYLRQMPIFS